MTLDPNELDLRKATHSWIRTHYLADEAAVAGARNAEEQRARQAPAALALVDRLRTTGDAEDFRSRLHELTVPKDSYLALSGPNGQMLVNQLVNYSTDQARVADLLGDALTTPTSMSDAARKIASLADYCVEIKKGTGPQKGRVNALLSTFWMLAAPETWPTRWSTANRACERLGWHLPTDPVAEYEAFATLVLTLGDPAEVLSTLRWYAEHRWLGPDPTVERRIAWAVELADAGRDTEPVAYDNVSALLGPLRHAGDDLVPELSALLDQTVTKRLPAPHTQRSGANFARTDAWVMWTPELPEANWQGRPGLRLQYAAEGVFIGLHPGYRFKGWMETVRAKLEPIIPEGEHLIFHLRLGAPPEEQEGQRDFHIGRYYPYSEVPWDEMRQEVLDTASSLLPLLQRIITEGPDWEAGIDHSTSEETTDEALAREFAAFVAETGYPTADDQAQKAARETMAEVLAPNALPVITVAEFRRILNTAKYGFAGNRSVLNRFLASDDEDVIQATIVEVVDDLLYGDDPVEDRIDRCLPRMPGLGVAGATKLLAIADPARFLPVYPLAGEHGKLALLGVLGIDQAPKGTRGTRNTIANDQIRRRLGTVPDLVDDPWGQMVFAYWLRDRTSEAPSELDDLDARLQAATDECTLAPESRFLFELHELLADKGQIVLYGPPGTGKTFVAQALAEALAPDPDRRMLVQFHPSTAYEDFMEGYRPVLRNDQVIYQLASGPLIELAERARDDARPHVLVIDEMNRANLPKVFGELLFLLEYRNTPMRLAYRGDQEDFALPDNLWVIGTMNLADRSVGQIDAALRRRFAFVPFSPNDEHNGGLLARWLAKSNQATWSAEVVDAVNGELEADLGHSDLLIGPSYFMKPDLDEPQMARIWQYAIEPLVSDLFHGDQPTIDKYSWSSVAKRHSNLLPGGAGSPDGAAPS